ncbi:FAD synthetase family protein [Mycobacterium xenopi 3993]|nr:FAD synthetase family protein [Mycobacterium xenopi 3993]
MRTHDRGVRRCAPGHAELIAHAVKAGRTRGVPTVLMTFDPHPMEVVFPGSHPAQLTTLARRAELVEELGIDVFLVMPFTSDFMKLTPERYIHELLVEHLHVVEVVVGENFTFGKKAAGTVETLRRAGERFGFAVEAMSLVSERHDSETVTFSSTYIRSCVDAGDVVAAAEALGRPHRVEGVVVRGEGRACGWAFPPQMWRRRCTRRSRPTGCMPPGSPCWGVDPRPARSCRASVTKPRSRSAPTRRFPGAPAPSRHMCSTPPPTCTASTWRSTL